MARLWPKLFPGSLNSLVRIIEVIRFNRVRCLLVLAAISFFPFSAGADAVPAETPGVAVLLVDTDRVCGKVEEAIYGQFLEHIKHDWFAVTSSAAPSPRPSKSLRRPAASVR